MTENRSIPPEDAKDGFDLLEYPCEFKFKAMVRVAGLSQSQSAEAAMSAVITAVLPDAPVIGVGSNRSRTGKFEAVSVSVVLKSREQLETAYEALAADSNVVMTL